MSATGLESIDHTVQLTHLWINDLDTRLGWENRPRAYRLLKSVLRAVRDWLPINEAVDLGAQLPALLRGAYYEQWHPAATPVAERSRADFIARVNRDFRTDPLIATDEAVTFVFDLLNDKISGGEIADVRQALPRDVRMLWPEPVGAVQRRAS
ncbi:MAG TPA: DUF2267 domain-containing protein [Xanthobacteraceae bacterium]|nr:DUF2267 domain-containing protein [Xanthobacteraceae bacterium]